MLKELIDLGLLPVPLPGTADSFVVPGFLQALGHDPVEFERHMLDSVRTVWSNEDLAMYPDQPVHVMGSHEALGYRGNEINRSKQWYEHKVPEDMTLRYYYTGHQWRICAAQRNTSTRPRLMEQTNEILGQKTNHVIFTLYRDGRDLKDMMKYNSRSCDPDEFETYLRHKNDFNSRYQDVYKALDFRKLKRNREMNEKRSEARFMNRFRETYGADAVVVFGDWEERPGFLRGKEPTKGKGMRSILRRAGFTVYLLDEFRTSKLCHKCHAADGSGHENESNVFRRADPRPWKQGKSQYIWGLLRCKNERCRCVHNRDFNSASNILRIARTIIDTGERPHVFRRTKPCNPVPVQDHGGVRRDSNIPLLTTND